ncbi:MAG: DNA methyltransferase [Devosia marina]|uniref:site-specific DNA-methyltransferase n=1 Tax=Devosia marina TaxID=2683198 RepID=UPI0032EBEF62
MIKRLTVDQSAPAKQSRKRGQAGSSSTGIFLASAIEQLPINSIKNYDRNPRVHDDRQITKLASTIRKAGFLVPIIVDASNEVVAGHGRLAAAIALGLNEVPGIRVSHLSPEVIKAYRLADNRLGELSHWDATALALEFKDLAAVELDLEILELTGFETAEIDLHIQSLDEDSGDAADELPELVPAAAVSQVGDLWQLGPHRLLCGSSLDEDSYRVLLDGEKVRAVWSDPPYNVPVHGHVSGKGRVKHREFAMASGEMSEGEFTGFLQSYLEQACEHSAPGALHYVCMDAAHAFELLSAARQTKLTFKTTCTWAKTNAGMGSLYRQQTEFVHVFKNGGDTIPHINNIQLGKYGRFRTTLWSYAGVNTFRKGRMDDLAAHPTVKPWALVADAIKDCTRVGESVLDCFCGSGTTLIAAEKSHRVGYGIELDPVYVDVAIRRWQSVSGKPAILAGTKQSFAQVEAAREAARSSVVGNAEVGHDHA